MTDYSRRPRIRISPLQAGTYNKLGQNLRPNPHIALKHLPDSVPRDRPLKSWQLEGGAEAGTVSFGDPLRRS